MREAYLAIAGAAGGSRLAGTLPSALAALAERSRQGACATATTCLAAVGAGSGQAVEVDLAVGAVTATGLELARALAGDGVAHHSVVDGAAGKTATW